MEHFLNQFNSDFIAALQGDHRPILTNPGYRNGHALAYFMEQFRNLLVWEDGKTLWLAKATPRGWLEQGKRISVRNAPTYFGTVGYQIDSEADHGRITATVEVPTRSAPQTILVRLRHPKALPLKSVRVNGNTWKDFDTTRELVSLHGVRGSVTVEGYY